jgi:hypothetical protein
VGHWLTTSIPPEMRLPFALAQTQKWLDRDYETMFRAKVAADGGKIPALIAGARERCYELKRCRDVIPPGTVKRPWMQSLEPLIVE